MTDLSLPSIEPDTQDGWRARIALAYSSRRERTRLIHCQRIGPLSVQRAFYPEGPVCHSYLLHPPGGVVGGDRLEVAVHVQPEAHTLITTPGATKFYRSGGRLAQYRQHFQVAEQAALEWLPQENIFFPDSRLAMQTHIELHSTSRFIGWEMQCLGRPVINERFDRGQIRSSLKLSIDAKPLLIEHFNAEADQLQQASAGLRGYPMQATLLIHPADDALLEQVRTVLTQSADATILAGATRLDSLIVVRLLGHQTEPLLKQMIAIWQAVRPSVMGRPACLPRIWAT